MSFRLGQKVICVAAFWDRGESFETMPVKDGIYTIRSFLMKPWQTPSCGLRFEEIVNPHCGYADGYDECAFNAECFRPLVTTDISLLTALLNPLNHTPLPEDIPVKAPARV